MAESLAMLVLLPLALYLLDLCMAMIGRLLDGFILLPLPSLHLMATAFTVRTFQLSVRVLDLQVELLNDVDNGAEVEVSSNTPSSRHRATRRHDDDDDDDDDDDGDEPDRAPQWR